MKHQAELKFSEDVGKVVNSIRVGDAERVTGGDMAKILTCIKDKKIYLNNSDIDMKTKERFDIVNRAILAIRNQFKKIEEFSKLSEPIDTSSVEQIARNILEATCVRVDIDLKKL
jgi:hypothetical protein